MSEVLVGALRYDVVMNTASVQEGTNVTKQELNTIRRLFKDLVDPAAEYEAHLENIAKLVEKGALTPDQGDQARAGINRQFPEQSGIAANNRRDAEVLGWMEEIQKEALKNEKEKQEAIEWTQKIREQNDKEYLARVKQQSKIDEEAYNQKMAKGREFWAMAQRANKKHQADVKEGNRKYLEQVKFNSKVLQDQEREQAALRRKNRKNQLLNMRKFADEQMSRNLKWNLALIKNGKTRQQQWRGAKRIMSSFFDGAGTGTKTVIAGINSMTYGMGTFGVAVRAVTGFMTILSAEVVIATAGLALVAAAIYGIYKIAKKAVGETDKMKKQLIDLRVLAGGEYTAKGIFNDLIDFANNSPYTVGQLSKLSVQMLSFGVSTEEVVGNLKALGEIAGGDENKLALLNKALSDTIALGRLQGQELRQFANQGFNPLIQMSKDTGKSYARLRKEMEDGAISATMITKAIENATKEGGLFYGRLEEGQNTISAQMSKMLGLISQLFAKLGEYSGIWETVLETLKNVNTVLEFMLKVMRAIEDTYDRIVSKIPFLDAIVNGERELEEAKKRSLELDEKLAEAIEKRKVAEEEAAKQIQKYQDEYNDKLIEQMFGEEAAADAAFKRDLQRKVAAKEMEQETANEIIALRKKTQMIENQMKAEEERRKKQEESIRAQAKAAEEQMKAREEYLNAEKERLEKELKAIDDLEKKQQDSAQKVHDDLLKKIEERRKKEMESFNSSNQAAASFDAGSVEEYNVIRNMELAKRKEDRQAKVDAEAQASRDAANNKLDGILKGIRQNASNNRNATGGELAKILGQMN